MKILKIKPMAAARTILIFAAITDFKVFAHLFRMIIFAENLRGHGRNNIRHSKVKPLKFLFAIGETIMNTEEQRRFYLYLFEPAYPYYPNSDAISDTICRQFAGKIIQAVNL